MLKKVGLQRANRPRHSHIGRKIEPELVSLTKLVGQIWQTFHLGFDSPSHLPQTLSRRHKTMARTGVSGTGFALFRFLEFS